MKSNREYRETVHREASKAVSELETAFQKRWKSEENDETMNDGDRGWERNDDEEYD